ncbi:MAG: site-2 protease family protein [Caldiserica bacterium]|jgi:Zn-dependent protease|nr:site-2 protease family protein [Caldisericota bacterium]MDH7562693.1 site-2 protease family protein [Caldisericota bacterium]
MPDLLSQPIYFIISLFILFFSIILHEVAHGWTAEKLGDPTARIAGRITLNPISHVDLFGTILLPLMLILLRSNFIIGWAKPVPVNFYRLRNPRRDTLLVSVSGIVTNFSLAVLASLLWRIFHYFSVGGILLFQVLYFTVSLNLLLCFFNLIPLPPLDGSKVLGAIFPRALGRMIYDPQVNLFGTFILFALLGTGLLWRVLDPVIGFFLNLFLF